MTCGPLSTKTPLQTEGTRRLRRYGLGLYRLGIVFAAFALVRFAHDPEPADNTALLLEASRAELPSVAALGEPVDGLYPLLDDRGDTIGSAARTFPQARPIHGYAGPSELAVIFDISRQVRAVRFLRSADTAGHVGKVRDDAEYWQQWNGRGEARLGDLGTPHIVSGATLTSEAMARGVAARFGAEGLDQWFSAPLEVERIQAWFPNADHLEEDERAGRYRVLAGGERVGIVLRSSRMGVAARGFNGSSDVIVALDPEASGVVGVGLLASRDNEPYVGDVKDELQYADGFAGRTIDDILGIGADKGLVVSGASFTASAVIESVREMLRREVAEEPRESIPYQSILGLSWIAAGIFMTFSKRFRGAKFRLAFAAISVAAGLVLGWMIGLDQLVGWSRHGTNPGVAMPWLLLAAVAMVIPALTGKNVYCSRICPHGAVQTIANRTVSKRFSLPPRFHRLLSGLPWLTLVAIWTLTLGSVHFPVSHAEPFEIWSSGFYAVLPATIFTIGLLAAFFLPQAYCHYGCPTGALLKFLTHAPGRWTRRDSVAAWLVVAATTFVLIR